MFFGDRVAAFTNMRRAAAPDARVALVCWRTLAENPWMEVPMTAAAQHLPPRPTERMVPGSGFRATFCDPLCGRSRRMALVLPRAIFGELVGWS